MNERAMDIPHARGGGSEKAVVDAIRAHDGGLGPGISEMQRTEIIYGRKNEPEKTEPVDNGKICEGFIQAIKDHPVEWLLE